MDKFLIIALNLSKTECKKLISQSKIMIDDRIPISLGQNIDSQLQKIVVNGKHISVPTECYYLMNKPEGVVSAVKDECKRTVIDLIKPEDRVKNLYPVGRLDRFTSGIMLITNNGPLGIRMLHPMHHVSKTYEVVVNGMLTEKEVKLFFDGIVIDKDVQCQSASMKIIFASKIKSIAIVQISEGKYHQIKKMFLSVGVKVLQLKRIKFAEFELGDLQPGEYRKLTARELLFIKTYLE